MNDLNEPHVCLPSRVKLRDYKYEVLNSPTYVTSVRGYEVRLEQAGRTVALLGQDGFLIICSGYYYNGPNWFPDIAAFQDGSLAHDALWEMISNGLLPPSTRSAADETMREINRDMGMNWLLVWITWAAVVLFGKPKLKT